MHNKKNGLFYNFYTGVFDCSVSAHHSLWCEEHCKSNPGTQILHQWLHALISLSWPHHSKKRSLDNFIRLFLYYAFIPIFSYTILYTVVCEKDFSMTFTYQSHVKTCIYHIVYCIWLFLTNTKHIPIGWCIPVIYCSLNILICLRWCG